MIQGPIFRVTLVIASLLAIAIVIVGPGFAQSAVIQTDDDAQNAATPAAEMSEQDKIAKALANPLRISGFSSCRTT